jgi:hypothetical protein
LCEGIGAEILPEWNQICSIYTFFPYTLLYTTSVSSPLPCNQRIQKLHLRELLGVLVVNFYCSWRRIEYQGTLLDKDRLMRACSNINQERIATITKKTLVRYWGSCHVLYRNNNNENIVIHLQLSCITTRIHLRSLFSLQSFRLPVGS